MTSKLLTFITFACVLGLCMLPTTASARPGMHTLRVEGAGAAFVSSPQTERFGFGGGFAASYELRPISWLGIEARYGAIFFSEGNESRVGTYHAPGLGLRLHPVELDVGDLWIGVSGDFVITGDVIRPGLSAGVGFEFEVAWFARVGPFIRFHHVFQPDNDVLGDADASFLSFGISGAFGGDRSPAAVADTDGDGIFDPDDACPTEPEDVDGFEDTDGCPDADNDGDGILDADDACPLEPEDLDGFEDTDGCPDADNDGDGIPDGDDACPDQAEDVNGIDDEDGCPEGDRDGDGIADASDACPDEPETMNDFLDTDGCPDEVGASVAALDERIFFDTNVSTIVRSSRAPLLRVVEMLRANPEMRVRVHGHTDTRGTDDHNDQLSRERGNAVRAYLVAQGIAEGRFVIVAHGENDTAVAPGGEDEHSENRRVVFTRSGGEQ